MAIGYTPKYTEQLSLYGISQQEFMVAAYEAALQLDWNVEQISDVGLTAEAGTEALGNLSKVIIKIEGDAAAITSESPGSEPADQELNKYKVQAFIEAFRAKNEMLTVQEALQKYDELKTRMEVPGLDEPAPPAPTTAEKAKGVLSLFVPRKGYMVTPILVDVNIAIFVVMALTGVSIMQPDNADLLKWGANFRPMTLAGEWWRLITNCFLHIGVIHLLMNMYALIFIGMALEPYLGATRFIIAYMLTGIAASTTSLAWHDLTISAGASGAIFGMYGVFLALLTTKVIEEKTRKAQLTSIGFFVFYNLAYGMKGGIDNAAHIGGLLSGIVAGYAYIPALKRPEVKQRQLVATIGLAVLVLGGTAWVYGHTTNDIAVYDDKMKHFADMEQMALEVFKLPENTPKEKYLAEIKDRGIYYWNEDLKILDELDKLKLPDQLHTRNAMLRKYCELRILFYKDLYRRAEENTDKYDDDLKDYQEKITAILGQLQEKSKGGAE